MFGLIVLGNTLRIPKANEAQKTAENKETALFIPAIDTAFLTVSAEVKKENLEKLLIKLLEPAKQTPFVNLVDYLLFLNDKNSEQLFPHTTNERIAAHVEDVLNMMVYELYFEKHMKEVGIDVLQFINPKQIGNLITGNEKAEEIKKFYLWLQTPDNQVRQRINIVDIKSPNIISKINLATQ